MIQRDALNVEAGSGWEHRFGGGLPGPAMGGAFLAEPRRTEGYTALLGIQHCRVQNAVQTYEADAGAHRKV
jgi:hypothetical protein